MPISNPFAENLVRLRKERKMSQQALADALGVNRNSISNWERGGMFPSLATMREIAAFFGMSDPNDLFETKKAASANTIKPLPMTQEASVFGSIAAGTPIDMEDGDYSFPVPGELMDRYPHAFYLVVEGESMNRVLPNGCLVLVDPDDREPVISGRVYAVAVNGYAATVKRIRSLENGFELIPDSNDPTFRPRVYDFGDPCTETITIIGRVVWYSIPFDYEI